MHKRIEKFQEILEKDLKEKLDKVINAGTVSPEDLTIIDKATDVMLDLIKYDECMMEEGGNSYDEYSTRRGRSMTTGRYMSRDTMPMSMGRSMEQYSGRRSYNGGYSGHFRDKLEMLYNEAQNEDERRMVEEMMNRY